jgi:hypothetical protein
VLGGGGRVVASSKPGRCRDAALGGGGEVAVGTPCQVHTTRKCHPFVGFLNSSVTIIYLTDEYMGFFMENRPIHRDDADGTGPLG